MVFVFVCVSIRAGQAYDSSSIPFLQKQMIEMNDSLQQIQQRNKVLVKEIETKLLNGYELTEKSVK